MLRALRPDVRIAHFTHTPFVNPAFLSILPDEIIEELLMGMAGADACGFHAPRWADAFEGCWFAHPSTRHAPDPATFIAPAAADHEEVAAVSASDECAAEAAVLDAEIGACKRIVRVDRIEPSKNLLRGFWAYRTLLEKRPEWRGKVCLVALCYPSRETLEEYQRAARATSKPPPRAINDIFGTDDVDSRSSSTPPTASPVRLPRCAPPTCCSSTRCVTASTSSPTRDRPSTRRDAPLLLSREAGAWDELGPAGAIAINPFDISGTADALHHALDNGRHRTQGARPRGCGAVATARTPADWLQRQLDAVAPLTDRLGRLGRRTHDDLAACR